jgi:hypothetical protein
VVGRGDFLHGAAGSCSFRGNGFEGRDERTNERTKEEQGTRWDAGIFFVLHSIRRGDPWWTKVAWGMRVKGCARLEPRLCAALISSHLCRRMD